MSASGGRFWVGLLAGAALGAGATWLAMARPWQSSSPPVIVAADAAPAEAPRGTRSRRGRGQRGGEGGAADAPPPVLSAVDRAMAWRGPAIALPTREVDLGAGDGGRPLEADEINGVIERSSGSVLACIREALAGAELTGEVRLELLVGGDGGVEKVRVGGARWLIDHGLADCAARAARRIRFPATGAPTVVTAPFHLE